MKTLKNVFALLMAITVVVLPFVQSGRVVRASTSVFYDSFEIHTPTTFPQWTSADPKWLVTSGSGHDGSHKAQVNGDTGTNDDLLVKALSTTGYSTITLSYYYRITQPIESDDHVYVEWSSDGGSTWAQLADYTNSGNTNWADGFRSFVLPSTADNNPNFQFRFRAHLDSSSHDEFQLDEVSLTYEGLVASPTPTPVVSPTPTPTPTIIPTPTPSPIISPTPSPEVSPSPSPSVSPSPIPSPSPEVSPSPSPSISPSPIPSPSPEISPSPSPEVTPTPSPTPVITPTPEPPGGGGGGSGATSGILIVTNTVINDGPGTKSVGDFQIFLDGGLITSGASYERTGYYHIVTQTPVEGYTTTFGGACAADGSVMLSPGETRTCTITNDDIGQVLGVSTEATPSPTPQGQVLGVSACGIYLDQFAFWTRKYDPAVVTKVQQFLNQYMNANLPVTGFFGELTKKAVMAFQEKHADEVLKPWGITMPTGHVYKTTQRMINNIMCESLQLPIPQVP